MARPILPGLDAELKEQRTVPSPTKCHLKGGQLLEDPGLDSARTPQAPRTAITQQSSPLSQPAICNKKQFPERRPAQQPGLDGGEFAETIDISATPLASNDTQVAEDLELRAQQVEYTKKIVQRHATGNTVNEWQYRTREVVTMRSKERAAVRWR